MREYSQVARTSRLQMIKDNPSCIVFQILRINGRKKKGIPKPTSTFALIKIAACFCCKMWTPWIMLATVTKRSLANTEKMRICRLWLSFTFQSRYAGEHINHRSPTISTDTKNRCLSEKYFLRIKGSFYTYCRFPRSQLLSGASIGRFYSWSIGFGKRKASQWAAHTILKKRALRHP